MTTHRRMRFVLFMLCSSIVADSWNRAPLAWAANPLVQYIISNGEIVKPLTSNAGNAERGKQIVLDRERGDCVVCHAMPLPDRQFHGTVGPPLDGVGHRYTEGSLRLRVVDAKAFNPQSVMPAYHRGRGLTAVRTTLKNVPILSAQEIEDVVAYLVTLTDGNADAGHHATPPAPAVVSKAEQQQTSLPVYIVDDRRSGFTYLAEETQRLQNDEFANPGMFWVERGGELWRTPEGSRQMACRHCHGEAQQSMHGVRTRYPQFDARQKKLIALEQQINRCRQERLGVAPYAYDSEALLALTTYIAHQSRGLPIAPQINKRTQSFFVAGKKFFMQRRGQIDLACSHCHDQLAGQRLRGDIISQGQLNGFPIYRQLWQTLGSAHRMFSWCNTAIRAEPLPLGSDAYVNLEFYMAWRARGLPVETPAIRR